MQHQFVWKMISSDNDKNLILFPIMKGSVGFNEVRMSVDLLGRKPISWILHPSYGVNRTVPQLGIATTIWKWYSERKVITVIVTHVLKSLMA